jgi:hypothetical protein
MFGLSPGILVTSFFLLVVEYRKTFVGVFVSSYTLSESKYDLHCVWPAMANLIPFPLLLCIKTVFPATMQKTKSNLSFNSIFENLLNSLFQNFQVKYDPDTCTSLRILEFLFSFIVLQVLLHLWVFLMLFVALSDLHTTWMDHGYSRKENTSVCLSKVSFSVWSFQERQTK